MPGVCLGCNWTRGTNPNRIKEVWQAFRRSRPDVDQARGPWNEPIQVPTLCGRQIQEGSRLFGRAASGMPELLLHAPVQVDERLTLWAFSDEDMATVTTLRHAWGGVRVRRYWMNGYDAQASTTRMWRSRIDEYFAGRAAFPDEFDFDRT